MSTIRNTLAATAVALLALSGAAQAADQSNVGTGTPAAKAEMDRGVPGVDVDVGKNAKGAVDVNVNKTNANEATPAHTVNGTGTMDNNRSGMRAARADRG